MYTCRAVVSLRRYAHAAELREHDWPALAGRAAQEHGALRRPSVGKRPLYGTSGPVALEEGACVRASSSIQMSLSTYSHPSFDTTGREPSRARDK